MAKKKKRQFRQNLAAIQANAERFMRERMPWLFEPDAADHHRRIHRKERLFKSR